MSVILNKVKELENRGNAPLKIRSVCQLITELLENLTKEERGLVEKELFEELARTRRLQLKVTCPQCKTDISGRFRVKLKSK
jgi:hypothetical protein